MPGLLPEVTPTTLPYWTGGLEGELRLPRCVECERYMHPSLATCRRCGSDLRYVAIDGAGTVVGFTVNHHQWVPDVAPPYVIALISLTAAEGVFLTTNIVGAEIDAVHIGQAVEVVFELRGDIALPQFTPSGLSDEPVDLSEPQVGIRPPATSQRFEHRSALTGIGMSRVGRRLGLSPTRMAVDAARAAVADAGLTFADIDGLCTYPGSSMGQGMSEGGIQVLEEALCLHPTWFNGGSELPGQGGAIIAAMLAVSAGLCRHVLCMRTVWEATYTDLIRTGQLPLPSGGPVGGDPSWRLPYGAGSAANWIGMAASQYLDRYGADREMLGRIAVNARQGAARNPSAIYRDPLTLDDYFAARMISTPFGLNDCDVPCDGAVAIIVSAADSVADCRHGGVRVEAVGTQITERISWDQGTLTHEPLVFGPGAHLWSRTALVPDDVDVALLYDGFSFNCVSWLEALGFCGIGEASAFIGDGSTIALGGDLPLNPHGGQLAAGRLHGFGFVHEAVLQLRHEAGDRQVTDAQVAVVSTGGGTPGGCFLLTREAV